MSGRTKPALILAIVFVLGGAAGAAATYGIAVRSLHERVRQGPRKGGAKFRLEAMRRRLDLNDEQVTKIDAIFREMGPQRDEAIRECHPRRRPVGAGASLERRRCRPRRCHRASVEPGP